MKKKRLFLFLFIIHLFSKSFSQDFQITSPNSVFDGRQLLISYNIVNKNPDDQFYVWVEIEKNNGVPIKMKAISGDIGDNIKGGTNKKIIWVPAKDSVFINEVVFVEVKAEKYIKSFNKGTAMLMSTALPGLGQTKISNGKPWWLTGVASYGVIVGGIAVHRSSLETYDSYKLEKDGIKRKDLYDQAQKQMDISNVLIVSGAVIWAANIIWVAVTPNKNRALQHLKFSLYQPAGTYKRTTLLTMRLNF